MSIFRLVILSFLTKKSQLFFFEDIDKTSDCVLHNPNFWIVYQQHYYLIESLTVHILESRSRKYEVSQFVEKLLQIVNGYDYFIPTKVLKSVLIEENTTFRQKNNPVSQSEHVFEEEAFGAVTEEEFVKIKTEISDSPEGHLLVTWDADLVHKFLDYNNASIVPDSRATYALLFLNPSETQLNLHEILRRFWTEYNVANVLAQKCSCGNLQVYMFRPFVRIDNSWGSTVHYSLENIANNFRLITNQLLNFNRLPLNISIFPRTPSAILQLPKLLENNPVYKNRTLSRGFGGVDGLILGTLAEYFNFEVTIVNKPVEDDYGKVLPNGTIIGALGDIAKKRAAFNANGRLLAYFVLDQVEFTIPYTNEEICVVVPKAAKVPRWMFLVRSLDHESWMCILLILVAASVLWYNIGPSTHIPEVFYFVFSYMFGIPIKTIAGRIYRIVFLIACMIFSIVVLGIIQGSFFKNLTTLSYNEDMTTLEEVADAEMPIGANIWHLVKDNSDLIRRLKEKSFAAPDDMYDLIAYERNVAAVDTRLRLKLLIGSKYMDEDGLPLLYIVDECITTFLTANIVPKNSPFLMGFNRVISKLFESGLTHKWYGDVVDSMITEKIIQVTRSKHSLKPLSLFDTQGAFHFIIVGYVCSMFVLLCEVLSKRKK